MKNSCLFNSFIISTIVKLLNFVWKLKKVSLCLLLLKQNWSRFELKCGHNKCKYRKKEHELRKERFGMGVVAILTRSSERTLQSS